MKSICTRNSPWLCRAAPMPRSIDSASSTGRATSIHGSRTVSSLSFMRSTARRFTCATVSHCDFFHIGTSRELLAGLAERNRTSTTYGFRNRTRTVLAR